MGCTPAGNKTFLVVCNIGLMFVGFTILSLGVKMKIALEAFRLGGVPLLMNSVRAVVATGFFISVTGGAGFCGSCYEIMWLILVHLAGLGLIVVMEFSLGITLVVIKNTVIAALEEADCGETCHSIVLFVLVKLASASSATMLTVIIIEALMIYSAVQLYYYLRDLPKNPPAPAPTVGPTVVVQNVQMQNMAAPAPPQQPIVMAVPSQQPVQYGPQQPVQYGPQQPVQYGPQQPVQYGPQQPVQCGPQQPYMAPPPTYSEAQVEQSGTQPQSKLATPPQNQSQIAPPLDTSTLTRNATKENAG